MKILIVHNEYQQRGGEDSVVASELALLRARGHTVEVFARHNDDIKGQGRLSLAVQTLWSRQTWHEAGGLMDQIRPDVVHVHNTLPLISPSVYWAAHRRGIPVVQTLHNFRLVCPQAMFLRNGKICEDCLGHVPWKGVVRGCYRGSRAQSAVVAASVSIHRWVGTYDKAITQYWALNQFCRDKFVAGGLPAEKIHIKPNFVEDRGVGAVDQIRSGGLFVGRLSPDKGVDVLLAALRLYAADVAVIGTGELESLVQAQLGLKARGFLPTDGVMAQLSRASYLVVPSVWYENFPRTIVEAYSMGVPVIASRLGALAELVLDGQTGLLFDPGQPLDLAAKLQWAEAHPERMAEMGRHARARFEALYGPEINANQMVELYEKAMQSAHFASKA